MMGISRLPLHLKTPVRLVISPRPDKGEADPAPRRVRAEAVKSKVRRITRSVSYFGKKAAQCG